uniref:Glutathione transferase n=1 Tax=Aplanochytrium stocchinoi TaxID=215587 RepID=A0A7S3PCE3_9STRA|mmetsp:Transcript_11742/g.13598  ORF Transcript_11742/g.13598 Transcript_11742/m.13598 type:complete len:224 (+) Transcript_11742:214-885(+)
MIRFSYFQGWGLGEPCRWMLAASNLSWEANDLATAEEFLKLRDNEHKLLFGQLPLLEIDGLKLVQSKAIVRYLARRANMVGWTPAESVMVDMCAETITDMRACVTSYPFSPGSNAEKIENAIVRIEKFFPRLEKILENRDETDFGFVSKLCYADVLLAEFIAGCSGFVPMSAFRKYKNLFSLYEMVIQLPGISTYLSSEKRYPFPEGEIGQKYKENVNTVLGR